MLKEALLYKKLQGHKVSCFLCGHRCLIADGQFGICQARQNKEGTLYTLTYGELCAANIDPIEKKPIFHMLPGSKSYSFAALGCNFRCGFCQNWQISQKREADKLGIKSEPKSPERIVSEALQHKCQSISYTYSEPTIFFEYALETAKLAKEKGLYNIFVTNGYMTPEALEMIKPYLDAANVDLKSFNDANYQKVCGGRLQPVLDTISLMRRMNIWVEITTLVIPDFNDSSEELKDIAGFLSGVGKEIPWHISRFHPDYKITDKEPTSLSKLKEAYTIGKDAGLRYVYIGNVLEEEKTYCYKCGQDLIARSGFSVIKNILKDGKCPGCATALDGLALQGK